MPQAAMCLVWWWGCFFEINEIKLLLAFDVARGLIRALMKSTNHLPNQVEKEHSRD